MADVYENSFPLMADLFHLPRNQSREEFVAFLQHWMTRDQGLLFWDHLYRKTCLAFGFSPERLIDLLSPRAVGGRCNGAAPILVTRFAEPHLLFQVMPDPMNAAHNLATSESMFRLFGWNLETLRERDASILQLIHSEQCLDFISAGLIRARDLLLEGDSLAVVHSGNHVTHIVDYTDLLFLSARLNSFVRCHGSLFAVFSPSRFPLVVALRVAPIA